jgi:multicomponent Na+:H+ antiporter subunit B
VTRATIDDRRTVDKPAAREATEREPLHRPLIGALLVAAVAVALGVAVAGIPREHAPLPLIARYALDIAIPQWKMTEPVNEIVYGTRGFDTFGETFLLLAAVVSVVVITRSREPRRGYFGEAAAGAREQEQDDPAIGADATEQEARSAERLEQDDQEDQGPNGKEPVETPDAVPLGTPAPERAEAMTVVVRTAIRVTLPILAVAGLYLVVWGYSPGGGFPGGAVMLGVLLLVYAAFGRRKISRVIRPDLLENLELAGAGLIIMTGFLGLVFEGSFSANWLPLAQLMTPLSGGVAQLFSASELIEVATGLTIAVFALLGISHDWARDEGRNSSGGDGEQGQ